MMRWYLLMKFLCCLYREDYGLDSFREDLNTASGVILGQIYLAHETRRWMSNMQNNEKGGKLFTTGLKESNKGQIV